MTASIPSMLFEKKPCYEGDWCEIDPAQLRLEISVEQIDLILERWAIVRTGMAMYRRAEPEQVKDWAKP